MAERNPFDQQPKGARDEEVSRDLRCEEWETLLADALDGVLPGGDSAAFETHCSGCKMCAQLLAEAKQGREWMQFLQGEPEMPADLIERILSKTSGAVAEHPLAVYGAPIAAGGPSVLGLPMRRMVWDTRLMMTAAMAFFSIALTLNLAGVRITDLRLSELTPASLENNLTRQFYSAKTQVVRYYDNLRFVYEVESKMRELRRDEDTTPPQAQPKQEEKPAQQNSSPSNGHKTGGKLEAIPDVPKADVLHGNPALASAPISGPAADQTCVPPQGCRSETTSGIRDEVETLVVLGTDQAGRSLA